jgi:hypothetical protein
MRSMNGSYFLCAVLACAPLTVDARAPASSEDGSSSAAAANAGGAAGHAAPTRDTSNKAGHTGALESTQTGVRTGGGSKGRDAAMAVSPRHGSVMLRRGTGQAASGSAERLHALLNAQARGRLAHQPGRPIGSTRAATGVPGVRSSYGVGAAGQPKLVSKRTASPAPKLTATPRESTIGGPHVQSAGRVGGPVVGRTNHSAAIDGTELRRKF